MLAAMSATRAEKIVVQAGVGIVLEEKRICACIELVVVKLADGGPAHSSKKIQVLVDTLSKATGARYSKSSGDILKISFHRWVMSSVMLMDKMSKGGGWRMSFQGSSGRS